jgi:hypothetical protein
MIRFGGHWVFWAVASEWSATREELIDRVDRSVPRLFIKDGHCLVRTFTRQKLSARQVDRAIRTVGFSACSAPAREAIHSSIAFVLGL